MTVNPTSKLKNPEQKAFDKYQIAKNATIIIGIISAVAIAALFFGHHLPGAEQFFHHMQNIPHINSYALGAVGAFTGLSTATTIYYYKNHKNTLLPYTQQRYKELSKTKLTPKEQELYNQAKELTKQAKNNKNNPQELKKIKKDFSDLIESIKGLGLSIKKQGPLIKEINCAIRKIEEKIKQLNQQSQIV